MKSVLSVVGLVLWLLPLWSVDFSRYEPESVRAYGVGDGLSEFRVYPGHPLTPGPSALAFDRRGNLYVCDAVRKRLAVGDRSLEIREEHYGIYSGYVRGLEVTETGIGNHDFGRAYSWVDRSFQNRFMLAYGLGNHDTEIDSSLYYGDVVFAYVYLGSLMSVVKPGLDWKENEGRILGDAETRALFRDPGKYGLDGLTLDDGGRLFVNGEIATRSYRVFLGWCEEQNGGTLLKVGNAASLTRDPQRSLNVATYRGKDMHGNVYWHAGDTILVFNASGAVIEMLMSVGGIGLGAVHPSGDLYGISYDEKGVYLHRIRNVWDPKAREFWESYVISTTGEGIRSAVVTGGPLRVRRAAGMMAEIEGELQKGDRVEVLWHGSEKDTVNGMSEYWYEVRRKSDGLQGWVFGGHLRID